jgi:DNA mismatch repair protein MutS2
MKVSMLGGFKSAHVAVDPKVAAARQVVLFDLPTMIASESALVPDLLHVVPTRRIDVEPTKLALSLAFSGGVSGGLFSEALEKATLAPSTWDPAGFAGDLFLQRFVVMCFKVQIGQTVPVLTTSHLLRLLSYPPADPNIVEHRRSILAELVQSAELRRELEQLYLDVCRLRGLLENSGALRIWDANRRKLDILHALKEVLDRMASGFTSAASGLGRLAQFGAHVQAGESYRALSDLLRYDAQLATLNLRVGVGADGRISGFEIVSVNESSENPFVNSVWRRWLAKLELFVRGYRFGDGEVMARLVDAVFTMLEDELATLVQLMGDLEFYLGALGFRDQAHAGGLSVCLPDLVSPQESRMLSGLFNPLLLASGIVPVPCDLKSARLASTILVTGPNSGGKTRLLQSVGLTQLLAQCGLFIPARSGRVALASGLVASLIEEAKADQTEGRLGTELLRIRGLFERLPPRAMVLLDELCSGTNPSEGEQIFELVVTMLERLQPQAFITTHFLAFAARLEQAKKIAGLGFLQVELDAGRRPTYQFTPGVAKTSLAAHTAERLGVTGDQLLSLIEQNIRKQQTSSFSGGR